MNNKRHSGILVHPTSFPSNYGIGDFGYGAYKFIDFLEKSGQKLWQVLPLNPSGYGNSPYQSFSSFAGNRFLISPDLLVDEGYLTEKDISKTPNFGNPTKVDYDKVILYKNTLLLQAYKSFKLNGTEKQKADFNKFCITNKSWLDDYILFIAVKEMLINYRKNLADCNEYKTFVKEYKKIVAKELLYDYYYGAVWYTWPEDIAAREKKAVRSYSKLLADEVNYYKFIQYEFMRQWLNLKSYANKKGIKIIGDLPIFVSADSVDVWANREIFQLNINGRPTSVAGVPPDYFSETGQLWGNPLYNYEAHKKDGYQWWISRFKAMLQKFDIIRIDHFRGFDSYWQIPYGQKTAAKGKWVTGPHAEIFETIEAETGKLPVIAEDLGIITDSVTDLRKSLNYPGMKVLQFAFDDSCENAYLLHNYDDSNCVVYTGTHDNDTTTGWYTKADERVKDFFRRYLNVSGEDAAWDMIRLAYQSTADSIIIPIQDLMRLDSDHRMNTPGTVGNNWQFRYTAEMLNENIRERLLYLNKLFNR